MNSNLSKTIKTAAIVVGLVITITEAIQSYFQMKIENARLASETQNSIRQAYLSQLFSGKIGERQEESIFRLLSRLSSDADLQGWAKDELIQKSSIVRIRDSTINVHKKIKNNSLNAGSNEYTKEIQKSTDIILDNLRKLGDPIPSELSKQSSSYTAFSYPFGPVGPTGVVTYMHISTEDGSKVDDANLVVTRIQSNGNIESNKVKIGSRGHASMMTFPGTYSVIITKEGYRTIRERISAGEPRPTPVEFLLKKDIQF